ncbi:unnamed protein product [Rotaria sp. Silwood1]|nr:unnamed protein product [Rotaria sp. Silwood1]CAF1637863.1 unnamed protein product [Rotaria sp. Silwood1]CAF4977434.1 unnamed protein product [Rotaria sp. Silwood1]
MKTMYRLILEYFTKEIKGATTSVFIEEIALTDLATSSRDEAREASSVPQTMPLVNQLNSKPQSSIHDIQSSIQRQVISHMGGKNSKKAIVLSTAGASAITAASSTAMLRRERMAENYLVIWVDGNIDMANQDCQNTMEQLRAVVNEVKPCETAEQCVQMLMENQEEISFVISSGALGQHLVPDIHDMAKLNAIFIFCGNKQRHQEEEILFSMHTVFRIGEVRKLDNNRALYQVDLKLTSDDDSQLRELTDYIRQEVNGTGWRRMGQLLLKIGQFDKAEELYLALLEQASDDSDRAYICHQLGVMKYSQGQYEEAVEFYEQSLKIEQKTLPKDDPSLAPTYNNIAQVYNDMGDYSKALEFYEKTLKIDEKGLPSNHPDLAKSYNNIGQVYNNLGNYSKALEFYGKDLEIRKKALPPTHPDLAIPYSTIGQVYNNMGDYSKALEFYEKSLEIRKKALPSNHPDLATSYNNIGQVYNNMGDYSKALEFLKKDLEITRKTRSPDHPDFASTYSWFGRVYRNMKDYSKSLDYFQKCLTIFQRTLPERHPNQAITYSNIGDVHRLMGDYEKAISFHRKALNIQENVQCNPLECATTYINLGETYRQMKDYTMALTYYQKGLEIRENKLPKSHPDLAVVYHNLAKLYLSTRQYNMAMKNVQQAVEIAQEKLPSNHPHILEYKETFEKIRKKM